MLVKCDSWPLVLPDDDGIRPAGRDDECFYCHSKVGALHGRECVCITMIVRYYVWMNLERRSKEGDRGKFVGTFTVHVPHFWNYHDCDFHKNESSWCANNALDDIEWSDEADAEALEKWMTDNDRCSCSPLSFEVDTVMDEGPYRELRDKNG
jgi:hypothetical protein